MRLFWNSCDNIHRSFLQGSQNERAEQEDNDSQLHKSVIICLSLCCSHFFTHIILIILT